jgi:hypothetical protein
MNAQSLRALLGICERLSIPRDNAGEYEGFSGNVRGDRLAALGHVYADATTPRDFSGDWRRPTRQRLYRLAGRKGAIMPYGLCMAHCRYLSLKPETAVAFLYKGPYYRRKVASGRRNRVCRYRGASACLLIRTRHD